MTSVPKSSINLMMVPREGICLPVYFSINFLKVDN
uniref:Uncharacterized protein n=1 Tax=Lepeophtheirus salmonis TaxID=72036 RepID=A0A0K2VA35_LEPSM